MDFTNIESAAMLTPGTLVGGDFRVVRLLREGGMGAVYLAEQVSLRETRAGWRQLQTGIGDNYIPAIFLSLAYGP